jgi:tetratricopeptide (TPR) repeat protein
MPSSHEIGEAARSAYYRDKPATWISEDALRDYGWDVLVTIPSSPGQVGDQFFIQLKGSEAVEYLATAPAISHVLEVPTVNWLLTRRWPAGLAVCDVARPDRPIYWVWIDDAIKDIEQQGRTWRDQDSITLRIPISNLFASTQARIEDEVRRRSDRGRINEEIATLARRSLSLEGLDDLGLGAPTAAFVERELAPAFKRAGLLDVVSNDDSTELQVLGETDRAFRARLAALRAQLDQFQDALVEPELMRLEGDLAGLASTSIALYRNVQGVLLLHNGRTADALEKFREAAAINPTEGKYQTNILAVEYLIAAARDDDAPVPDWEQRLDAVLARQPDFVPALRLKVEFLGLQDTAAAEALAMSHPALTGKPQTLALLAGLHLGTDNERALRYLDQAGDALDADPFVLANKGFLLFSRAVGCNTGEFHISGLGPSVVAHGDVRRAAEAYERACRAFALRGYPAMSEHTFRNAGLVFLVAGEIDKAIAHCRAFLNVRSSSAVLQTLTVAYAISSGHAREAVAVARQAWALDKTDSQAFRYLLQSLHLADHHEEVVELFNEREAAGFANDLEEIRSRELAALALGELGQHGLATQQLDVLTALPHGPAVAAGLGPQLAKLRGASQDNVIEGLREAHREHPADAMIPTLLVRELLPPTTANAGELVELIRFVADHRQLLPQEVSHLAHAHTLRGEHSASEQILRRARERFPHEVTFIYLHAQALFDLGDEDGAYAAMRAYVERAKHSYATYRNLGILARNTGRLDEAIRLIRAAAQQEADASARGQLFCQLYELAARQGAPARERLGYAMQYGRTSRASADGEARFLMMCLMLPPLSEEDRRDSEVQQWRQEISTRLHVFTEAHPDSNILRRIPIPEGLEGPALLDYLESEMAYLTLPGRLAASRAELASRGKPLPFVFRMDFVGDGPSLVDYWERCTHSDLRDHRVLAFLSEPAAFKDQIEIPARGRSVCLDLLALLTLHELGLLDRAREWFGTIVLAHDTRRAVERDALGFPTPSARAQALDQWLRVNRGSIRIRQLGEDESEEPQARYAAWNGLWIPRRPGLGDILGEGVGATLLLARKINIPVYTDDALVCLMAPTEAGVAAFGTVAFLRHLRAVGTLSVEEEATYYAQLLKLNYREMPLAPAHFDAALGRLIRECGASPRIDDVDADPVLGTMVRHLADSGLADAGIFYTLAEWLANLGGLVNEVPLETKAAIGTRLSFIVAQRDPGSVLRGLPRNRPQSRMALLWCLAILQLFRSNELAAIGRLWSLYSTTAEGLYPSDEDGCKTLLGEGTAAILYLLLQASDLPLDQKDRALVVIPQQLPGYRAEPIEKAFFDFRLGRRKPGQRPRA